MIQEMEKLQAKGEVGEEEMRALEIDVTGRVSFTIPIIPYHRLLYLPGRCSMQIMLASWRGTRFEVVQVLREVSPQYLFWHVNLTM
jgi:hypothetical protein